jgi:hypothetical protein
MKKILLIIFCLFYTVAASAQHYSINDLMGRWRTLKYTPHKWALSKYSVYDMVFISNTAAAYISPNGLLYDNINYIATTKDDMINLKFTMDIRSKRQRYGNLSIKFLNDSTFLLSAKSSDLIKVDTGKIREFKKVKIELPGTEPRLPNYTDLIGEWGNFFKGKITEGRIIFIDNTHVIFKGAEHTTEYTYKIDFARQPIGIDFYSGSTINKHAILRFDKEDALFFKFSSGNVQPDRFTTFGLNYRYMKLNSKKSD